MEKNTVIINKKTASNTKIIEINGDVIVPDIGLIRFMPNVGLL